MEIVQSADRDRRRSARAETFIGGKIVIRDGTWSFGCVVLDMSDGGARIAVPPEQLIPKRFYLVTSKHEVGFDAELRWQRGNMIGIQFLRNLDLSDPQSGFLKDIADELRPRP